MYLSWLEVSDNSARKTKYDLVAVRKEGLGWVCRFVNEVLQKGERVQDLFRRAPVERTHREIVICPFSYGELLFEVLKRIEAMQSVELFVVLAVTALHFTVVPWGIWPYHFVTDAQFL